MTIDSQISEREREILRLVATGATNQQIAHQLNISVNTVKVHLRNIFGKIGVASRTEATVYAIRQGLLEVTDAAVEPSTAAVLLDEAAPPAIAPANEPAVAEEPHRWDTVATNPVEPISAPVLISEPHTEVLPAPAAVQQEVAPQPPLATHSTRRTPLLIGLLAICVLLAVALTYVLLRDQTRTNQPQATTAPQTAGPEVGRWKTHSPLNQPRSDFAATGYDGKLYIIGGTGGKGPVATLERYDPTADQSAALSNKPTAASRIQATTFGGRIFVPGGEGSGGAPMTAFEAFDPRAMQWETLPALPAPRSRYAIANLDGRLYLFGGWDGKTCTADVFIYDPNAKQWSASDPMPTPRCNAGAAVIEGQIYVVGGENDSGPLRANERYDPTRAAGRQWENGLLPLPAAISLPASVEFARTVLIFDPTGHTAVQYYPRTDTWATVAVAQDTALSNRAVALGSNIFTFGQSSADQPAIVSEYQAGYNTFLPGLSAGDK